ncbi:TetR/AcrR family transcriptional regulator [Streptomyces sp. NPDC014861]|uniref:TetR/AcrR family transcriptional regulator n=1 Tax=Streptomyces sp. NPDC014861 TaxID=3364923 RepID=UPI0036FC6302
MENEKPLRERLVDIGVDLVTTEGSASVGLREIARRAGVSHGAPRRYFPTHHALLSAIAQRGFEDLGARFMAAIADGAPPRAQLRAVARVYVGYALEHRGMFELMFRHDLLDSEENGDGERQLRKATLPLFERVVTLVAQCQAETDTAHRPGTTQGAVPTHGVVPTHGAVPTPTVTAAALWSNLHGIAQLWAWGSLQLAIGASLPDGTPDHDLLEPLLTAVLNAHLDTAA